MIKNLFIFLAVLTLPLLSMAQCSITALSLNVCTSQSTIPVQATSAQFTAYNWSTSGTGTFDTIAKLNPIYMPSIADKSAGTVKLIVTASGGSCIVTTATAIITLLQSPTINAGFDMTSCGVSPIPLTIFSSNSASISWSSSGTGTFTAINATSETYTPSAADVTNGTATITATAIGAGGCIETDQAKMTIMPSPTLNTGFDMTYCAKMAFSLSDVTAQNADYYQWTSSGTGTFSDATLLQPVYQPSSADDAAGKVTLTLKGYSNGGCLSTSNKYISFYGNGMVNAGPDLTITNGVVVNVVGSMSGANAIVWSSNGTGTFSGTSTLTTTYSPSAADIVNGIVKLTLTGDNGSCPAAVDQMLLTIGSDFTLSGMVLASTNALDKGIVNLFKQNTSGLHFINSDTISVADAGKFTFAHIPAGVYVLYASPMTGSSALNTFLPTYSGGTQTWQTAQTITVSQNFSYTIQLTPYTSAVPSWNTGADKISGSVVVSASATANARTMASNVPAAYVTVYLTDPNGRKIAYTQTDLNGKYTFTNVMEGSYKIQPEFVGTGLPGSATSIPLSADGKVATVEDGSMILEAKAAILTGIGYAKAQHLAIYPNPATNIILFEVEGNSTKGMLKILNQTGNVQLQKELDLTHPEVAIDIESFPAGVYLLQVTTANELYTSKIVKY